MGWEFFNLLVKTVKSTIHIGKLYNRPMDPSWEYMFSDAQ